MKECVLFPSYIFLFLNYVLLFFIFFIMLKLIHK